MTQSVAQPFAELFYPPYAIRWMPAFAALAMGDPVAGAFLGPFIGPESENVGVPGMHRARVPGHEHFLRTWEVILPGFLGQEFSTGYTQHTIDDHQSTRVPGELITLPVRWIVVLASDTAADLGRPDLYWPIQDAARRFAEHIRADLSVLEVSLGFARAHIAQHFASVQVPQDPGQAFWRAMDHGLVRQTLGGEEGRVNVEAVMQALYRHLPPSLAAQYMQYAPHA